jgi:hypothetical protein
MRIKIASCLALFAALCGPPAALPAGAEPSIDSQLAKFREVRMPLPGGLTQRERHMVDKLVEATRLLDEVFWQQADPEGLTLYRSLVDRTAPEQQRLRRFLRINGGRYDLINDFAPFGGAGPRPPGGTMFPADLSRAEFDAYVAAHPQEKAGLYDELTVVRRQGAALRAIPYHVEYRRWLLPMAKALREAAALSDDPAFAKFLSLRAEALLSDDYFASDLAWLDLKNPKFDLIFAPYETYLDHFLGVKASFGAAVLIRNETESRKLDMFQAFVPDIQDALPLAAEDRPSKHGHASPMEVMDAPYRGGDLRHGYQAVADNLPNDPRVHEQKGSKKIFFKNFMDARVNEVILPIAARLLREDQVKLATAQGYLTGTIMHEIAHGLGPAFARTAAGRQDIRASIGPQFSGLEESKADITGLFGLAWLADHGRYPKAQMPEIYVSHIAGIFRTVRFGVAEAHGRAEMMEFNFLSEHGAIRYDATTQRYSVDVAAMPAAVAALARELLEQEASGDRARAERWFGRYGAMPPQLAQALDQARDVPVDVDPIFDFRDL